MSSHSAAVFVAPPNQRVILSAMIDLSALGLLDSFGWLEAPEDPSACADAFDPQLIWIENGTTQMTALSQVVHRHDLADFRLILLVPVGLGEGAAISREAEIFYQGIVISERTRRHNIRVLIPFEKSGSIDALGRAGWHNLMLSPEISADPSFQGVPWWGKPELVPGAAAVGLAATAGIVGMVSEAPFDGTGPTYVESVQVMKSFARVTVGKNVENKLRSKVLHIGNHYPAPERTTVSTAIRPFGDPLSITANTADEWALKHQPTLRRPRQELPPPQQTSISFFKALKWFFSFLWTSLVGAPRRWLAQKSREAKATLAHATSSRIFGDASTYRVIVKGVNGEGNPAGWEEVLDRVNLASAEVAGGPSAVGPSQKRDFSNLWEDMLGAGRSLLDGSAHSSLGLSGDSGYVADRRDIAAPLDDQGSFTLRSTARSAIPSATVPAWDELAITQAGVALTEAANEGGVPAAAAATELEKLKHWRESNKSRFLPRIGRHLGSWFEQTQTEIRVCMLEIDDLTGDDSEGRLERKQARLGLILKIISVIALVGIIALVILGAASILTLATVALVSGVLSTAWALSALVIFVKIQRDVFQILNQRQHSEERLAMLEEHLRLSLEDLQAIGAAYHQYRQWATLMTAFISDPLGQEDATKQHGFQQAFTPKNLELRPLRSNEEHLADTGAALRARSFKQGWMSQAWVAFEKKIPDYLDAEQRYRWNNGELAMESCAGLPGSPLSNWVQGVSKSGVRSDEGTRVWRSCLEWLDHEHISTLALEVETAGGWRPAERYRKDLSEPHDGQVLPQVLRQSALVDGLQRVLRQLNWYRENNDGLSSTMVLVQLTAPIEPDGFVYRVKVAESSDMSPLPEFDN